MCATEFSPNGKRKVIHGRRADLLGEIADAIFGWEIGERKFWEYHGAKPCCGTINNCPLQRGSGGNDGDAI
jgi:hypothetical protein